MTKLNDPAWLNASGTLSLPQSCTPEQQAARKKEVAKNCEEYVFDHSWQGYPPSIAKLPGREKPLKEYALLLEAYSRIVSTKAEQWVLHKWYELKLKFTGKEGKPFEEYAALFTDASLPMIGKHSLWQQDAVFASEQLNGMYPWFIQRVVDLAAFQRNFPVTDAILDGLLPPNQTLAALAGAGRLYYVSQAELNGAPPAHGHVMTAPTTLFCVDDTGQLMPLGIQLYPVSSPTNPVFTPHHDPNTWLAMKIHASCAENLVHAIYCHAIIMHFVMSNMWTAANRTLPAEHPLYAFLKPHFWATLLITYEVKKTMDTEDGDQTEILGTGLAGQNQMVSELFKHFDFRDYDPNYNFSKRGVDDVRALPHFYYRDDALKLWAADLSYVTSMLGLFYKSDADVLNDFELQAWMAEMASTDGAGIVGLPVNAEGKIETKEALYQVITSVLFSVTSRHSSIENGALNYAYPPASPVLYRLAAPQEANAKLKLSEVSDRLPPVSYAIAGCALIASANFAHTDSNRLGKYDDDFTNGWPKEVEENIEKWRNALNAISVEIDARNQQLDIPYTAMNPKNTFNSIWN